MLYASLLLFTALNFAFLFKYGNPDWKPLLVGYLGLLLQAGALLAIGTFISTLTKNQIIAGAATFAALPAALGLRVGQRIRNGHLGASALVHSVATHFESFATRRARHQRRNLLHHRDFPGTILHGAFHGISALEVLDGEPMAKARQTKYAAYAATYILVIIAGSRCRQRSRRPLQQVVRRHVEQAV